jgi:hypothetical protein
MASLGKVASLIAIVALAASGLLMIAAPVHAAMPMPSAPTFSLKIVAHPYDVAPITTVDPYTGKTVITQAGYHVENKSIQVQVTNQPFSYSFNGTTYHLYYSVRVKGHFENIWKEYYAVYEGISYAKEGTMYCAKAQYTKGLLQSNSDYSLLSIPASNYPDEGQLDIQVQEAIGHDAKIFINENWHIMDFTYYGHYEEAVAVDTTSDWSGTQIINLDDGVSIATTPTPTPYQSSLTPTVTGLPSESSTTAPFQQNVHSGVVFGLSWEELALVTSAVVIAVLAAALVFALRRRTKT